jgi:hypothetical protein
MCLVKKREREKFGFSGLKKNYLSPRITASLSPLSLSLTGLDSDAAPASQVHHCLTIVAI